MISGKHRKIPKKQRPPIKQRPRKKRAFKRSIFPAIRYMLRRNLYRKGIVQAFRFVGDRNVHRFLSFSLLPSFRRFRKSCEPGAAVTYILRSFTAEFLDGASLKLVRRQVYRRKLWRLLSGFIIPFVRRAGVFPQYFHLPKKHFKSLYRVIERSPAEGSFHPTLNKEKDTFLRRVTTFWLARLPYLLRVLRSYNLSSIKKMPLSGVFFYRLQFDPRPIKLALAEQIKNFTQYGRQYTKGFAKNRINYITKPFIPVGNPALTAFANNPTFNPVMPLRVIYKRSGNNIFSALQLLFPYRIFVTLSSGLTGLKGRRKGTTNAAEQLGRMLGDRFLANARKVVACEKELKIENATLFRADFVILGENFDTLAKSFLSGLLKSRRKFIPVEQNYAATIKKTVLERSFKIENVLFDSRYSHNGMRPPSQRRV